MLKGWAGFPVGIKNFKDSLKKRVLLKTNEGKYCLCYSNCCRGGYIPRHIRQVTKVKPVKRDDVNREGHKRVKFFL